MTLKSRKVSFYETRLVVGHFVSKFAPDGTSLEEIEKITEAGVTYADRMMSKQQRGDFSQNANSLHYHSLRQIARKAVAEWQNKKNGGEKPYQLKTKSLRRLAADPMVQQIAKAIGPGHAKTLELTLRGKTLEEIASELETSISRVAGLNATTKVHYAFYANGGGLLRKAPPTMASRQKATGLIAELFPELSGNERAKYIRLAALGLDNRLPAAIHEIYKLRRIVQTRPKEFPAEITQTLQQRSSISDNLKPVWKQIEMAAKRGDRTAIAILQNPPHKQPNQAIHALLNGKGICARHPDLFTETEITPREVRSPHPAAMETRRRLIEELAKRGEITGIIAKQRLDGIHPKRIAKTMKLSLSRVREHLKVGQHAAFGIRPTGISNTIAYNELMERNEDLFPRKKKK